MTNNYQIKTWIDSVINSCNTWEQVTTAEKLVKNFKDQLIKNEYDEMLHLPITISLDYKIDIKRRELIEGINSIINN